MANPEFQPDWFSKPGDTLSALMGKHELSPQALALRIGCDVTQVQGLLTGTIPIDNKIAVLLEKTVGGSSLFWATRQAQYDQSLCRAARAVQVDRAKAWLNELPIKDMVRAGWIAKPLELDAALRSALSFFDVTDPDEWQERYAMFENMVSFRASQSFESKVGALSAWLRRGEILADAIPCTTWNPDRFRSQLPQMKVLTKAKNPAYFVPRLRALCAQSGVAVVVVRAPGGCRASGAARFLSRTKAMIILSFRHLSDDHFWFTFFHEAGHLLVHGDRSTFVDGDAAEQTEKEREANAFSVGVLIPRARHDDLIRLRPRSRDVIKFAISIGVSPGIVVGQMQHLKLIGPAHLNHLKRRFTWEQIIPALA